MFSRVPFSMHLCSLWYSVLKVLPVILSRVWSFSLIQEVMWVPPGFPISAPQTGNSLKALACNVCDPISFFFFLSVRYYCSSFPAVECLENHSFIYFCLFCCYFRWESHSDLRYSILVRGRNMLLSFYLFSYHCKLLQHLS